MGNRWDNCVEQVNDKFEEFLRSYLDDAKRSCLVIGGAGFDPRATVLANLLKKLSDVGVKGLFFREERLLPQKLLRELADENQDELQRLIPGCEFQEVKIFFEETTPIGGREVVNFVNSCALEGTTDVFVDISALSTGVFFPLVKLLLAKVKGRRINVHLFAAEKASIDHSIRGIPCDSVSFAHGFRGTTSINPDSTNALLWLPTLAPGTGDVLERIHNYLSKPTTPIDVCPIVPFPGHDPRLPDKLIFEFKESLPKWRTDGRNLLYAAESDALDAYRTICSIHDTRGQIFSELGGSTIVLSPVGNKMLAVGAMLAAIEKNLPVAMVESLGYQETTMTEAEHPGDAHEFKHLWLAGEAYEEWR